MVGMALLALLCAFAVPQVALADKIMVKEGLVADERSHEDEPEVHLLQPLIQLNTVTFGKNVLQPSVNGVERWVVLYCLSWYEPCEALERPFSVIGGEWQDRLNTHLLSTEVRFATVDCATDKVLCNEQMIFEFPKIVLYHKNSAVSAWSGGGVYTDLVSGMRKWVGQQFSAFTGRGEMEADERDTSFVTGRDDFRLDILAIVLAMLGNAWVVTRNSKINSAEKASCMNPGVRKLEHFLSTSVSRFVPEHWAVERSELEL